MYSWIAHWIFVLWDALLVVWAVGAMTSRPTRQPQDSNFRFTQIAIQVVGLWMLFGSSRLLRGTPLADDLLPGHTDVALTGLSLTVAGMLFSLWARISVGRNRRGAVTLQQEQLLICGGPYRLVRHPVYAGLILAALGTAIVFLRVECFVGVLLIASGFWFRLRLEEQMMMRQFGEEYARYRSRVRALIPFVF